MLTRRWPSILPSNVLASIAAVVPVLILILVILAPAQLARAAGYGQWEFNGNLSSAAGGQSLIPKAIPPAAATSVEFVTQTIGGAQAQVARFARGTSFRLFHGIAPNGGGTYVNVYTLILDVMFPDRSAAGGWATLYQTNPANTNDGDWFINPEGRIGILENYGGSVPAGEWRRLALVIDLVAGTYTSYVNGVRAQQNTTQTKDGRFSLDSEILLFGDNDGDQVGGFVNSVQIRGYAMKDDELLALGGPAAAGIPVPPDEECRVTDPAQDCNRNGVRDLCDIRSRTSFDCNGNNVPDECDLASGLSADCDRNGIPDECQIKREDCDRNGIPDGCDIAAGRATDRDGNGLPDPCQMTLVADWRFDGDLHSSTGRSDLVPAAARPATQPEVELVPAMIGGKEARVARFSRGTYFIATHGFDPGGDLRVNRYSVILDVVFDDRSPSGGWGALWQATMTNGDDADWYVNPGNGVGLLENYGGSVLAGDWHRLVLVVDAAKGTFTSFVDGVKVQQNLAVPVDGRYSLGETALIFADDTGDNASGAVNGVQLRGYAMSDAEVAYIGGPHAHGIPLLDANGNGVLDRYDIEGGTSADADGDRIPDEWEAKPEGIFLRGDTDGNGSFTIGDGIQILDRLFTGRPAFASKCDDAGDTDDNGSFTLGDAIIVFNFLFAGGKPPAPPGPGACGPDPTPQTTLGACEYPAGSCP